ncbi:MAG: hypothetical protein KAT71_08320 [Gammaproteobacteria bacterium]|nr:hypothetical protein [Gammaproteobacteria bacterium]
MSLASTTNRNTYLGNAVADTFSYTFRIVSSSHLYVVSKDTSNVETVLVLTTDYTVTGVGDDGGGDIVLVAGALALNYDLTIRRVVPLTQTTDIRNQGDFYPEVHEDVFDKNVMIAQQQQDEVDRSMKLPETTAVADFDTTLPTDLTAEYFLKVNAEADGFEMASALETGNVTVPSGTGVLAKTSATAIVVRTITGTSDEIDVTNGDGVSGNPTLAVATTLVNGQTNVIPQKADSVLLSDSSDSNANKKATIASLLNKTQTTKTNSDTPYTITAEDHTIFGDQSSGVLTVTLPTAVGIAGKRYAIINVEATNALTLDGNGTETINGYLNIVLTSLNDMVLVESDNANWKIISSYILPTVQEFTSGSATYTTPLGVKFLRVRMIGGGGGGAGGGSGTTAGAGGTGVTSSFGTSLLSCVGGFGGANGAGAGGTGGTASLGSGPIGMAVLGAQGGQGGQQATTGGFLPGPSGAYSQFGGGADGGLSSAGTAGQANSGGGGGAGTPTTAGTSLNVGGSGGSGGYIDAIIANPSATYAYAVGAGGSAGSAGTTGAAGGAGGSGYIIVEEVY